MGGSTGSSTTTQSSAPPAFQQEFLEEVFGEARDLFRAQKDNPLQLFGGVEGFNPLEQEGQQGVVNFARGGATDIANQAAGGLDFALNQALDPASNSFLTSNIQSSTDDILQRLTEQVLPNVRNSAVGVGGFGGSRQGIAEAQSVQGATEDAFAARNRLLSDAFNQGQQTFRTGLSLAPQIQALGAVPSSLISGVGTAQRDLAQSQTDLNAQRSNFDQLAPFAALQQFLSSVGGNFGGQGTSTSNAPRGLFSLLFG